MKKSTVSKAVRPVTLDSETSAALRAWVKPLSLTPDREGEFLTSEARACLVALTDNEVGEYYNDYVKEVQRTTPKSK